MTKGKKAGVANERPYEASLETIREGIRAPAVQGDIAQGDGMIYNRRLDTLKVQCAPGVVLRITPGRRFAGNLHQLMGTVEAEAEREASAVPEDAARCENCGLLVRQVEIGGKTILLDTAPDENGIYLIRKPGQARMIDAFESPSGPTFHAHSCTTRGA
jgi:hypothetical protein